MPVRVRRESDEKLVPAIGIEFADASLEQKGLALSGTGKTVKLVEKLVVAKADQQVPRVQEVTSLEEKNEQQALKLDHKSVEAADASKASRAEVCAAPNQDFEIAQKVGVLHCDGESIEVQSSTTSERVETVEARLAAEKEQRESDASALEVAEVKAMYDREEKVDSSRVAEKILSDLERRFGAKQGSEEKVVVTLQCYKCWRWKERTKENFSLAQQQRSRNHGSVCRVCIERRAW